MKPESAIAPTVTARIRRDPKFEMLVRQRRNCVVKLTLATLVPYYGFIFIAGVFPQILAKRIFNDGVITIGWPVGVALIVGAWILTGLYIRRANSEFDELTKKIISEAEK